MSLKMLLRTSDGFQETKESKGFEEAIRVFRTDFRGQCKEIYRQNKKFSYLLYSNYYLERS